MLYIFRFEIYSLRQTSSHIALVFVRDRQLFAFDRYSIKNNPHTLFGGSVCRSRSKYQYGYPYLGMTYFVLKTNIKPILLNMIFTLIFTHARTHTHTHLHAQTNTHTHKHTITHTEVHTYSHSYVQAHTRTHIHPHVHNYTHMYTTKIIHIDMITSNAFMNSRTQTLRKHTCIHDTGNTSNYKNISNYKIALFKLLKIYVLITN